MVGDNIYKDAGRGYQEIIDHGWTLDLERLLHFPRQLLHSRTLEVVGAEGAERLCWEAPLPPEFAFSGGEDAGNGISS